MNEPLLNVEGLSVRFPETRAVRDVSFTLDRGECLAVVGESGSGKSVTARSLVGLAGDRAEVTARRLEFAGLDLASLDEKAWRRVRGGRIGLVLQDALVSLDPLRTAGAEIAEALRTHTKVPRDQVGERVRELLVRAGVPEPEVRAGQYPHQLSGGLRQRALIASAIAAGPELVIADEPTTALDVTVQAQILALIEELKKDGTAVLLISHDLAVVSRLADRIAVMYGGTVVEHGPARQVLDDPRHPYTRALIAAVPEPSGRGSLLSLPAHEGKEPDPDGCPYAARCVLADDRCRTSLPALAPREAGTRCWHPVSGPITRERRPQAEASPVRDGDTPLLEVREVSKSYRGRPAVSGVSLSLLPGESLGIVGESGSGKTTLARIVLGLVSPDEGSVSFAGVPWSALPERRRRPLRHRVQAIVQDPLGSFDPRHPVSRVLDEALALTGHERGPRRRARAAELLALVGLSPAVLPRSPSSLSGGQRQRIAIARALASEPELLVCDEPVSALDVSVQAQILDLLTGLRARLGLALLFISHDLGVVHHVSDRVAVMKDGRVVETGEVTALFQSPSHPYTKELFASLPALHRVS
ncbi:ABC transporter ATP-binding protein [Actinocorallia aurantiaca]|uniref:ABC transporter ATP-binding protein n=1 Tax=Actinocorallia aurantiaca TaxID=46204 RepID=A0ABN3U4T3_9ACTN